MKKATIWAVLLAVMPAQTVVTSCNEVEDVIEEAATPIPFTVKMSFDQDIPLATLPTDNYVTYPDIPIKIDIDSKINELYPGSTTANLRSASIEALTIDYLGSSGVKLDVIRNARLSLKIQGQQRQIFIGEILNNNNPDQLIFSVDKNADLLPYLQAKNLLLVLEMQGRQVVYDANFRFRINPVFRVSVGF